MWEVIATVVVVLAVLWFAAGALLRGPDLSLYDEPPGDRGTERDRASPENAEALRLLAEMQRHIDQATVRDRVAAMRRVLELGIAGSPSNPSELGVELIPAEAGGVPAEWVLAPKADPSRRLLYLHGGAFVAGSPRSHRALTAQLGRRAGVSVLAIDYRLMPEHPRAAGVEDCRRAYRWLLENGPDGPGAPRDVFVAGDSAGGNLTLALIAWIRDQGLRQPNAAIAFSPATDSTLAAPSMRHNIATDPMLGPLFGRLVRLPKTLILLGILYAGRMRPTNPVISPVHGDLAGLPPTLVQASETEMLADDARRWVNKARSQGTDARLQTWPEMLHVWQIFAHVLPESNEALESVTRFIDSHANRPAIATTAA